MSISFLSFSWTQYSCIRWSGISYSNACTVPARIPQEKENRETFLRSVTKDFCYEPGNISTLCFLLLHCVLTLTSSWLLSRWRNRRFDTQFPQNVLAKCSQNIPNRNFIVSFFFICLHFFLSDSTQTEIHKRHISFYLLPFLQFFNPLSTIATRLTTLVTRIYDVIKTSRRRSFSRAPVTGKKQRRRHSEENSFFFFFHF